MKNLGFWVLVAASTAALALQGCGGSSGSSALPLTPSAGGNLSTLAAQAAPPVATLASAGVNWQVQTGASTLDQGVQDLDYYANTIVIDAGDSVTWRIASKEPHTITFVPAGQTPPPNPVVPSGPNYQNGSAVTNSGFIFGGSQYTLKFPKPGVYPYQCFVHPPEMVGTIVVQQKGAPYPHTQGYYTHAGIVDEWNDFGAGMASVSSFPYAPYGTHLAAGIAPGLAAAQPSQSTVLRFLSHADRGPDSGNVTIKVGTTLTWTNQSNNEPHTITFPRAGHNLPAHLPFDPGFGGPNYDGSAVTNSGSIFPNQSYSLTFTKAGVYKYYCLYHFPEGMEGTITVVN